MTQRSERSRSRNNQSQCIWVVADGRGRTAFDHFRNRKQKHVCDVALDDRRSHCWLPPAQVLNRSRQQNTVFNSPTRPDVGMKWSVQLQHDCVTLQRPKLKQFHVEFDLSSLRHVMCSVWPLLALTTTSSDATRKLVHYSCKVAHSKWRFSFDSHTVHHYFNNPTNQITLIEFN